MLVAEWSIEVLFSPSVCVQLQFENCNNLVQYYDYSLGSSFEWSQFRIEHRGTLWPVSLCTVVV